MNVSAPSQPRSGGLHRWRVQSLRLPQPCTMAATQGSGTCLCPRTPNLAEAQGHRPVLLSGGSFSCREPGPLPIPRPCPSCHPLGLHLPQNLERFSSKDCDRSQQEMKKEPASHDMYPRRQPQGNTHRTSQGTSDRDAVSDAVSEPHPLGQGHPPPSLRPTSAEAHTWGMDSRGRMSDAEGLGSPLTTRARFPAGEMQSQGSAQGIPWGTGVRATSVR